MGKQCKKFSCELVMMLENIPENRPLYKDSGLWQVRTDDMEDIIFEQKSNESFFDFIKRVYDNLKKEQQCAITSCIARLFDDVTKNSNADRSRVVAGFDKGKLCFYELDLHEETVKRYLTTVSLNVP